MTAQMITTWKTDSGQEIKESLPCEYIGVPKNGIPDVLTVSYLDPRDNRHKIWAGGSDGRKINMKDKDGKGTGWLKWEQDHWVGVWVENGIEGTWEIWGD